ncbi:hypothetical protein Ddye_026965 [Dipteronia dyeriana]|uniref:Cytochrome P450 n=1 Tax=Dipteronia dyeriana TaxID=168575 RepID=A0AAD9TN86_9ROSI|nr:hypothetical protein Ddye_026965 [Dipteronia dyeriana]
MFLTWTTTLPVLVTLLFFLLQAFRLKRNAQTKPLPPGPRGFPIFGSLHLLGKYPHKDLQKLGEKYGSIMHLRLGLIPTIVVSSPQAAELFLKTHDHVFASRPSFEAVKHMNYDQKDLIFAPYGSYWRTLRKMCTSELLSNHKIDSFKSMRKEELCLLIDYIKDNQEAGVVAVDLSDKVTSLLVDMSCRMVFGKKYGDEYFDERGFKAVIQEGMKLVGTPNLGDYIPQIASLDLHRVTKKMKAVAKAFDVFFEKIIDEHVRSTEENKNKDFVDVMLGFMGAEATEYRLERDTVKAILLDLIVAAIDPTATTIEWALSELIKRPRIMKKLQKELVSVVGLDRMVEESDLDNLEYLDMVIKENFRFRPVSPLLVPHESVQDCTVNGFRIPNKSRIMINVWAIGRDASIWSDPDEFLPERFVGSNIEPRGRDFELLPFGSGRRACAGMQLGLTVVRLVLAQLVHCFDWELPDGILPSELDMTEEFGQVIFRAKHLLALPTYRLNK